MGAAAWAGTTRFPSPRIFAPVLPGGFQGIPRLAKCYSQFTESWVPPRVSSWRDMLGTPPKLGIKVRHTYCRCPSRCRGSTSSSARVTKLLPYLYLLTTLWRNLILTICVQLAVLLVRAKVTDHRWREKHSLKSRAFSVFADLPVNLALHPTLKESFVYNSPLSKVPNPLNAQIGPRQERETDPGLHPASHLCSTLPKG